MAKKKNFKNVKSKANPRNTRRSTAAIKAAAKAEGGKESTGINARRPNGVNKKIFTCGKENTDITESPANVKDCCTLTSGAELKCVITEITTPPTLPTPESNIAEQLNDFLKHWEFCLILTCM